MTQIMITRGELSVTAELDDSATAAQIIEALPFEGRINTWGEEIYFEIPVSASLAADARADVEVGDVAYWPTGNALCVFFGPTPVSDSEKPRAASPVNLIGEVLANLEQLHRFHDGDSVMVSEACDLNQEKDKHGIIG
jgi:uncharacterized protein